MSRPEAKWTSTAGTATVFGQREMLSGESRLKARPRGGLFFELLSVRQRTDARVTCLRRRTGEPLAHSCKRQFAIKSASPQRTSGARKNAAHGAAQIQALQRRAQHSKIDSASRRKPGRSNAIRAIFQTVTNNSG